MDRQIWRREMKLKESDKLDWPRQVERGDRFKVFKDDDGWRIRTESRREVEPCWFKDGVLHTYWPDGRVVIEISGQNLLGVYRTKRAALAVVARLEPTNA